MKLPGKFVTEFNVEDNLYSFVAAIHIDFVEVSFALNNNPLNIANLNSKNYQGTLGSGIFRSVEKLFELYDVEKWKVLAFKTPKTIKDADGKPIPNPLVKFYDSKYLQRLICDKLFAAEFLDRKESSGMVI